MNNSIQNNWFMLLDEDSVITAAHCFEKENEGNKEQYQIRTGLEDSSEYRIKVLISFHWFMGAFMMSHSGITLASKMEKG